MIIIRGVRYFLETELPYDVTRVYGADGYAGYRVGAHVQEHDAVGLGVYHYFRDYQVTVEAGVVAPERLVPRFVSPLAVYLAGQGTMRHIINAHGATTSNATTGGTPAFYCSLEEGAPEAR